MPTRFLELGPNLTDPTAPICVERIDSDSQTSIKARPMFFGGRGDVFDHGEYHRGNPVVTFPPANKALEFFGVRKSSGEMRKFARGTFDLKTALEANPSPPEGGTGRRCHPCARHGLSSA